MTLIYILRYRRMAIFLRFSHLIIQLQPKYLIFMNLDRFILKLTKETQGPKDCIDTKEREWICNTRVNYWFRNRQGD